MIKNINVKLDIYHSTPMQIQLWSNIYFR